MRLPETKLDKRFSEPDAIATSWDDTQQALEAAELFWITTVRRDGRPHVTPLVAVWLDEALYFCTGPSEQKAVNLATNPHVTLTTGRNEWDRGLDVVVEGTAARVTDGRQLRRLADAWATKWDGRWRYEVGEGGFEHENGGQVLVFAVEPAKVIAYGKGAFSQTRHLFSSSDTSEVESKPSVFRPGGVSYLHVPAADPGVTSAFYEAVFGWRIRDEGGPPAFEDGSAHVIGHFIPSQPSAGEAGVRPYVFVENVDATLERVVAHGGEVVTAPYAEGDLWVATYRDPAGNVLGVWQTGPRGAAC